MPEDASKHSKNPHAVALSSLGSSKGGKMRAQALPAAERKAIAQRAAVARWDGKKSIRATNTGTLQFGELQIECANLEDGRRVLSERTVLQALGRGYSGYYSKRDAAARANGDKTPAILPRYVAPAVLRRFMSDELVATLTAPIAYKPLQGGVAHGLDAGVLWKVCSVWTKARDAGALTGDAQFRTAARAETIMNALGEVGIVALIDEATGYQVARAKDELQQILNAYIAKELQPWVRKFPDEFFLQMFRLKGWKYGASMESGPKGPRYAGKLVNEIVYDRLPPGVREELQRKNPPTNGRRKHKHHQFLTEDIGNDHLRVHLTTVTAMMRGSDTWDAFKRMVDQAFPVQTAMALQVSTP